MCKHLHMGSMKYKSNNENVCQPCKPGVKTAIHSRMFIALNTHSLTDVFIKHKCVYDN